MDTNNHYIGVDGLYKCHIKNNNLWITFDHEKETNPFSRRLTVAMIDLAKKIEADDAIQAVVYTGGLHRSYCAGGDFNDVEKLREEKETRDYLLEIIDLYQAILNITKPTISLIDKYAIGQGLQVALMTDIRIATTRAQISMPELKNGVACPLGATILETYFGRAQMLEDVVGCGMYNAEQSLQKKYFTELCPVEELILTGEKWLEKLNQYPQRPFRTTKKVFTKKLYDALEDVREPATDAHVAAILERTGQKHFSKILNKTQGYGQ